MYQAYGTGNRKHSRQDRRKQDDSRRFVHPVRSVGCREFLRLPAEFRSTAGRAVDESGAVHGILPHSRGLEGHVYVCWIKKKVRAWDRLQDSRMRREQRMQA